MDVLKELRKQKKISQAKLADDLHVTQATVSRWETGEMLPTIDILNELSRYFSVSLDYLLGNDEKSKTDIPEDDGLTPKMKMALEIMRGLPDDLQAVALSQLQSLANLADKPKKH